MWEEYIQLYVNNVGKIPWTLTRAPAHIGTPPESQVARSQIYRSNEQLFLSNWAMEPHRHLWHPPLLSFALILMVWSQLCQHGCMWFQGPINSNERGINQSTNLTGMLLMKQSGSMMDVLFFIPQPYPFIIPAVNVTKCWWILYLCSDAETSLITEKKQAEDYWHLWPMCSSKINGLEAS